MPTEEPRPDPVPVTSPADLAAPKPGPPEVDWKAQSRKWEARAKEGHAALFELREQTAGQLAQATAEVRRWRTQPVAGRVQAHAVGLFADPSDAVASLGDLGSYLDPDGHIDEQRIQSELADVLDRKPHWRATPCSRVPAPNFAQSSGGNGGRMPASPADTLRDALASHSHPRA